MTDTPNEPSRATCPVCHGRGAIPSPGPHGQNVPCRVCSTRHCLALHDDGVCVLRRGHAGPCVFTPPGDAIAVGPADPVPLDRIKRAAGDPQLPGLAS